MMDNTSHFLLVDDDDTFTGVVERGLRRRGIEQVSRFDNAPEAIANAPALQPTHIVLDLNMPGMTGLMALPQLLQAVPEAKLVVLTGYSSIATAVEATKLGATNYLCKPATLEELLQAFEADTPQPEREIAADPISVDRLEWEHIQRVLKDCEGNVSATARALGMHRRTLQRKLQKRPVKR